MTIDPLQILCDLVAIPSVNPMRPAAGAATERGVADYIEGLLRREGIDCERQPVIDGRENVIAVVHASAGGGHRDGLMLNSHMDTVPAENMSINPFDPEVRDGRLYGRGACDAKGPIAAMLVALIEHARRPRRPVPVLFAAMVDEEFSFAGSWKLIEREWPVSACVIGEPTRLARVVAHKGVTRWRLRVGGVSAHGATPHLGRSAIYDGARVALALEDYAGELARRAPHALLGAPSLNVGRVAGGQAVNVVPDLCVFEIDRRTLPAEDGRATVRECEAWVRERLAGDIELSTEDPYLVDPALDTPPAAAIVRAVGEAHEREFGRPCPIEGANYGTDGSKLARAGIATVVCGPGDIAQAHTRAEYIEIEQVALAVRLYGRLIAHWPAEELRRH